MSTRKNQGQWAAILAMPMPGFCLEFALFCEKEVWPIQVYPNNLEVHNASCKQSKKLGDLGF